MRQRLGPYAVSAAAVLALATACGGGQEAPEGTPMSRASLEEHVSGAYEPDDPGKKLRTSCEGELRAVDDARQDCTVTTGRQEVGVRAVVTDVEADDLGIETTPFLPPESVAGAIAQSLEVQGYTGVESSCDRELFGEVGASVTCEVSTPEGDTIVNADVTSVEGLLINFDFSSS